MKLRCLFGHDWASVKVAYAEGGAITDATGKPIGVVGSRWFYDNECRRCGKRVEMTFCYENARTSQQERA